MADARTIAVTAWGWGAEGIPLGLAFGAGIGVALGAALDGRRDDSDT